MTPQQTAAQEKEDQRRIEKVQGAESLVTEADGAPERVFIGPWVEQELDFAYRSSPDEIEYVRADLHADLLAERDMLLHTLETRAEREMEMLEGVARENDALKAERDALKAVVSDPQRWLRWCDSRVLEENEALKEAARAALKYLDDIDEKPIDSLCPVCTGDSVPYRYEAKVCWRHQLEKAVKNSG